MIKHVATIKPTDKFRLAFSTLWPRAQARPARISILCILFFAGCDRMITPASTQTINDADARSAQGDFLRAISLYESALDGTSRSADVHYKLALLYDDRMSDPLNALHHFKRYLTLQPTGTHASEVKNFIKRDEVALLTSLSGDSVVTRTEAARLKNENLSLRKQIEERAGKPRLADEKTPRSEHVEKASAAKAGGKTYVVESGDTLFSISRKFYKSPSHWKQIREANREKIEDPAKLKPGQSLIIP